jgi:hypothetical protein
MVFGDNVDGRTRCSAGEFAKYISGLDDYWGNCIHTHTYPVCLVHGIDDHAIYSGSEEVDGIAASSG